MNHLLLITTDATNWEAISAIGSILSAIATFLAVVVSLSIALKSTKAKTELLRNSGRWDRDDISFRIVNKSFVPVTILKKGFVFHKPYWKNRALEVIQEEGGKWSLGHSEQVNIQINKNHLSKVLITNGFKPRQKIKLLVLCVDSYEKKHLQKFTFEVFKFEEDEPNLVLNKKS